MKIILAILICANVVFAQQTMSVVHFGPPDGEASGKAAPTLHSGPINSRASGQVHKIPFPAGIGASNGNEIELSISNSSNVTVEQVKVEITNVPVWLKFVSQIDTLPELKSKQEQTAVFTFAVEKTAPVNKEQTLNFAITDKSGQRWLKEIKLRVMAPLNYELYQNYPNPFNPTTVIEYQLPGVGTWHAVSLRIYDILGREVARLVNEQQEAGYYQKTFDAHRYASGVYIYQLIATDERNNKHAFRKKMILLR